MYLKRIKSILSPLVVETSSKKRSDSLDAIAYALQKELAPTTIILNDEETAAIIQMHRGKNNGLQKNLSRVIEERDALQKFKDFVHRRLDELGIPTHPEGEHSKAGCRIGDRIDIIEEMLSEARLNRNY